MHIYICKCKDTRRSRGRKCNLRNLDKSEAQRTLPYCKLYYCIITRLRVGRALLVVPWKPTVEYRVTRDGKAKKTCNLKLERLQFMKYLISSIFTKLQYKIQS